MAYEFIPAAMYPLDHAGLGAYVKYGRPAGLLGDQIQVVESSGWHVWMRTPDRELLLVRDGYKHLQIRPLDAGFDEYISFSPFHITNQDMQSKWYMINYFQHMSKGPIADFNLVEKHPLRQRQARFLADSGGFQIATGKAEFINPVNIANWYHHNVDVGIALDIPISNANPFFIEAAQVQKINTNMMFTALAEHGSAVEIMNVYHGRTVDSNKRYHDVVYDPRSRRLCLAGIYFGTVVNAVDMLWRLIDYTKGLYDHYHILGVYNLLLLPALIYMAHAKQLPLLTSDASTHIMSANMRMYHMQRTPEHPVERLVIGTKGEKQSKQVLSAYKTLACNCPVCRTLKYYDIFSTLSGATPTFLMAMHNMNEILRYSHMMSEMARQLPFADYRKLVELQLANHSKHNRQESLHALDYINEAATNGTQAARKRFSMFLHEGIFTSKSSKVATSLIADEKEVPVVEDETYSKIMATYNAFQASNAPETVNKKVKHKKGYKAKRNAPNYTTHVKLSGVNVKKQMEKQRSTAKAKLRKKNKLGKVAVQPPVSRS